MITKPEKLDIKIVVKPSGKVYRYHRKTGRPIKGEPGTPEFDRSFLEAERPNPKAAPPKDKLRDLFHRYRHSPEWSVLAEGTRYRWGRILDRIEDDLPWVLVEDLNGEKMIPDLYEWRDKQASAPAMADQRMDVLRHVLSWAKTRRIISSNPTEGIGRLHETADRSQLVWTPEAWATLLEHASDDERRYLLLALYTGARREDLAAMTWAQIKDGWLAYVPSKTSRSTKVTVELPTDALPPLADLLAEIPRRNETILTQADGRPWASGTWGVRMMELKAEAFPEGTPLRFHDIRGTTISKLYEAGCTDAEVAAISGHMLAAGTLRRYAKRSRSLALSAYQKWTKAEFAPKGKVVKFQAG